MGSKRKADTRTRNNTWIENIHLFEGIAMLITGPVLMLFPNLTLYLYDCATDLPAFQLAADVVPWFRAVGKRISMSSKIYEVF